MPTAPQTPQFVDFPIDGLPSKEAFTHHDAAAPDAQIIAQMANAFFGALPNASLPTTGAVTQQSGAPALAGALPPAVTPSLTDIPAPSIATSVAPHAPARAPFGPMDFPPTTIPSVVPTPNVPAPSAPQTLHSSTRPLGLADIPQPGASLGGATSSVPGELDYSEPTRRLAQEFSLVETTRPHDRPATIIFFQQRRRLDPQSPYAMKRARPQPARAMAIPTPSRRSRRAERCVATNSSRVTRKAARRREPIRCIRGNSPKAAARPIMRIARHHAPAPPRRERIRLRCVSDAGGRAIPGACALWRRRRLRGASAGTPARENRRHAASLRSLSRQARLPDPQPERQRTTA